MTEPAGRDEPDLASLIRSDLTANTHNSKGRAVLVAFRLTHELVHSDRTPRWGLPLVALYRLFVDWIMGIDLPATVVAGPGLAIWHGTGLVVHQSVRLGAGVTLRHGVTLGTLGESDDGVGPTLGDRVSVGAGAIVLGPVRIGDDAVIGAGAVVVGDVPDGATVVGNPARVLPPRDATAPGT